MTQTPAEVLHGQVERLINTVEAKFQYIRDIQGDPINLDDPQLVRVVNAHGAVIYEIAKTVGLIGRIVEQLIDNRPDNRGV
jgi:hypothetical protein